MLQHYDLSNSFGYLSCVIVYCIMQASAGNVNEVKGSGMIKGDGIAFDAVKDLVEKGYKNEVSTVHDVTVGGVGEDWKEATVSLGSSSFAQRIINQLVF